MPKYTGVRRKGKKLYIRYMAPAPSGERKEVEEPTTATTFKDAAQARARRQAEAEEGTWKPRSRRVEAEESPPLGDLVDRFLEAHKTPGGSEHYEWLAVSWRKHLPLDKPGDALTPQDVERFRDLRLASARSNKVPKKKGAKNKRVSPSTVRKEVAGLSTLFNWGQQKGLCHVNPAEGVKRPSEPLHRTEYLTDEDVEKLLAAAVPWVARCISWMLNTGMDRSEVVALDWNPTLTVALT